MKPITPKEVVKKKKEQIPPEVLEAFDELIAENWNGHCSTFSQKDVSALIRAKLKGDFPIKYLDVEDIYRKAGWKVDYDKPGYNESYDASFEFSKRR